jgi:hypothetical protein
MCRDRICTFWILLTNGDTYLRSFANHRCGEEVKKAGDSVIPLLRGVEGCVFSLYKHTPATAQSHAPPLERGT